MERIHMADVLPLLNLPGPSNGQRSYYITCPCCDDNPRKRHLNISLEKDVFRCPRCGFSGGIFDLYAYYTGIDRKHARKELLARLNIQDYDPTQKSTRQKPPAHTLPTEEDISECPLTDIDTRHETYTAFLDKLSLSSDHLENLQSRGLSKEVIAALEYRTTPVAGMTAIATQLQSDGIYLAGVPGFYRTQRGNWTFVHEQRGILIPVRNPEGKIQGLQLRRDNVSKRKFRWISSIGKPDGCKAEGWTHLAGTPSSTILLTEGPMKADVIHHLTGKTVLAVPGVNSLTQLRQALCYMRKHGTEHIMTAFDMDFFTNPHVQNGYQALVSLLSDMDFQYGTYVWDSQYKGLDDYIWQHCKKQQQA